MQAYSPLDFTFVDDMCSGLELLDIGSDPSIYHLLREPNQDKGSRRRCPCRAIPTKATYGYASCGAGTVALGFSETLLTQCSQDRLRSIHFRKAA